MLNETGEAFFQDRWTRIRAKKSRIGWKKIFADLAKNETSDFNFTFFIEILYQRGNKIKVSDFHFFFSEMRISFLIYGDPPTSPKMEKEELGKGFDNLSCRIVPNVDFKSLSNCSSIAEWGIKLSAKLSCKITLLKWIIFERTSPRWSKKEEMEKKKLSADDNFSN